MRVRYIFCGVLFACGGQTLDMGFADDGSVNPQDPVDMSAVRYRCGAPAGTDEPYTTDAAARAVIAGRWFLCETSGDPDPPVPQAIEFTAEGSWFTLVAD